MKVRIRPLPVSVMLTRSVVEEITYVVPPLVYCGDPGMLLLIAGGVASTVTPSLVASVGGAAGCGSGTSEAIGGEKLMADARARNDCGARHGP